jgi:hypothetical protein
MFDKAKFERLVVENDKYLILVNPSGLMLIRTNGSGDEKDRDIELTWDEIYELKDGYTVRG